MPRRTPFVLIRPGFFVLTLSSVCLSGCAGSGQQANSRVEPASQGPFASLASLNPFAPTADELLRDVFNPYDADGRRAAVTKLIQQPYGGSDRILDVYRLLLGGTSTVDADRTELSGQPDPDPTVRASACRGLSRYGTPNDAVLIAPRLRDDSEMVRLEAGNALQYLDVSDPSVKESEAEDVVNALINTLTGDPSAETAEAREPDSDGDVRAAAAYALGRYRSVQAYKALAAALFDRDYAVVQAAHRSLIQLTGEIDVSDDPDLWIDMLDERGEAVFAGALPYEPKPIRSVGFFGR